MGCCCSLCASPLRVKKGLCASLSLSLCFPLPSRIGRTKRRTSRKRERVESGRGVVEEKSEEKGREIKGEEGKKKWRRQEVEAKKGGWIKESGGEEGGDSLEERGGATGSAVGFHFVLSL